jgi:hypothetical protein
MKITTEQLRLYQKYSGDDDGLALAGTPHERNTARDAEWPKIRQLIQSLALVSSGLAAEEFRRAAIDAAESQCADDDARKLLMELANASG